MIGPRKPWGTVRQFVLACALCSLTWLTASAYAQSVRHLDEVHVPRTYDSLEEWHGEADALRTRILVSAGLSPMPERIPLSQHLGEPIERDGHTVQSVALETYPGFFVTGNLYRPAAGDGPYAAVLSPHGHWTEGRFEDSELASVPGRAINFARRGYVVFTYSMIGYNETADRISHRFTDPAYELWGFTPMGLQLWNSLRALDFLSSLPDVDSTRIGMTGASGGGTQTFLLTAIDERIKVSAPVNMISAHMQGGCVCENAPLLRLDATNIDFAALAAPRPMLMVSTTGDWTANTPSVEYPAVRSVYRLFGAEDRIRNVHLDYPHNYNRESREAVYAWFDRWLQGADDALASPEFPFRTEGQAALRAELPDAAPGLDALFQAHRKRIMREIRAARPEDPYGIHAYRNRYGAAYRDLFTTTPDTGDADLDLDMLEPEESSGTSDAVLIVTAGDGLDTGDTRELAAEERSRGRRVFTLRPYPREFIVPDSIAHWTTYNATTTARRVDEIRRAIEQVQSRADVNKLDVVGLGEAGLWTLLARGLVSDVHRTRVDFPILRPDADRPVGGLGAVDPVLSDRNDHDAGSRIVGPETETGVVDPDAGAEVVDENPDATNVHPDEDAAFVDHAFVPLLRRVGDFKTAAVLIAPAHLEIRNLRDDSLRTWMEQIYRAADAPEMLHFE